MCWRKGDLRKAGIIIAGMLLLLILMTWIPSAANAHEGESGSARPGTVMVLTTPTEDVTVTALNKEKLTQEVDQQQHTLWNWLWSNAATIVSSFLSTLVVVIGFLFGFWQWRMGRRDAQDKELKDRQTAQDKELVDRTTERERRAEERFQAVCVGLGGEREEAKAGAAIVLRTFLRSGYEQFFTQAFDLAVAHLRLPRTSDSPQNSNVPLPLTTLSQALIVVFKEAFSRARDQEKRDPPFLDARGIQLDNAYLRKADLKQAWLPQAFLRNADLSKADLSKANLGKADLREADLYKANLSGVSLDNAKLNDATLAEANLSMATFSGAILYEAVFDSADLRGANLSGSLFRGTILCGANLSGANLYGINFNGADLRMANLSTAGRKYVPASLEKNRRASRSLEE